MKEGWDGPLQKFLRNEPFFLSLPFPYFYNSVDAQNCYSAVFLEFLFLLFCFNYYCTQQTQRHLFDLQKTSPQVTWKRPYFKLVLKNFSDLKKGTFKSSLRPLIWDVNMIKKKPFSRLWDAFCAIFHI